MPHCTKCGAAVAENAGFCPSCGAPQSASGAPPASNPGPGGQTGLSENVAGLLCYVLGWVTGLVFFLIDKRPYVRFHAAQSIVLFGGLHILRVVLGMVFGIGFGFGAWGAFSFGFLLFELIGLLSLVLWILLMIKAYQGERFRVPVAADIADSFAK
jgi:uncharacterized membrane protein